MPAKPSINKAVFLAAAEDARKGAGLVRVVDALNPVREELVRFHREGVTLRALWDCVRDAGVVCSYVTFVRAHGQLRKGPPRPLAEARSRSRAKAQIGVVGGTPPALPLSVSGTSGTGSGLVPVPQHIPDLDAPELTAMLVSRFGSGVSSKKK